MTKTEDTGTKSESKLVSVSMNLPPPTPMEIKGDALENWKFFKLQFENYSIATGLNEKEDNVKVATFLSIIGKDCLKIFTTLDLTTEQKESVDEILKALDKYFEPEKNVIYERYVFGSANQEPDEKIEHYICRLRQLSSSCDYKALESELIRDRLVSGVHDLALRKKLLSDSKLTLATAIDTCRAHEATDNQMKHLSNKESMELKEDIYKVQGMRGRHHEQGRTAQSFNSHVSSLKKCIFCGTHHQLKRDVCPAFGKSCAKCQKPNHFAKVCKSSNMSYKPRPKYKNRFSNHSKRNVNFVESDNSEDMSASESLYKLDCLNVARSNERRANNKQWFTKVAFSTGVSNEMRVLKCQLDTGASCNIMHESDFKKLHLTKPNVDVRQPYLKITDTVLKCYSGNLIKPVGEIELTCVHNDMFHKLNFKIVDVAVYQKPLLSAEACEQLGILKLNADLCSVRETKVEWSKDNIIQEFDDVFKGLGKLPGLYHLEIDQNAVPVKHAPRRVPIPLRSSLKLKLSELEAKNIIKKESNPTEWISSMVLVVRNDKIRICIDPKDLNLALRRSHYQIPTIDEILPNLANAKVFTSLDAKDGYWQIQLDETSSKLTTFWTPEGRYRWLRLPFGLAPAAEEFQRRLHEILDGLDGVCVIADDILVYGCGDTYEDAIADHDIKLRRLLERARDKQLKLNKLKLKLRQNELAYMGHILTQNGLKADDTKIQAIIKMARPQNVTDLQRFLGLINYLAKFVPALSDKCEVLRQLNQKDVPWTWDETHESAFENLKQSISSAPVLKYFDVTQPVTVQCDASEIGLGCCLIQSGQPVAYASRTMSNTERRYAQIEKECLAILFGCNRFRQYICGKEDVTVETDHQPLVSIFKKSVLLAPKRLQCMMLKLQSFNINVVYKKGSQMYIADTLSRAAQQTTKSSEKDLESWQIYQLQEEDKIFSRLEEISSTENLNVTERRLRQIQEHTIQDKELQKMKKIILNGWPFTKNQVPQDVRQYWNFRDELSIQDGIIFRNERLVVPKSLRKEMLTRIHASHQGMDACLRKAREILYWPHMSEDIKHAVSECSTCLELAPAPAHLPMQTHRIPDLPWKRVALDIFHYKDDNFLITVDYFSDFFELDKLPDLTSGTVVEVTKKNFSRHGCPLTVVTDNSMAQFSTSKFHDFSREWDFNHISSSPYHPRGNGKVESAVKIAKYLVKKTQRQSQDLWMALLEWRNTPTKDMDSSPVQRLMSRRTRTLIPVVKGMLRPSVPSSVQEKLILKKKKYKAVYDKRSKPLPELEVGEGVVVKRPTGMDPKWRPGKIVEKPSTRSYIVEVQGKLYRRNREFLNKAKQAPNTDRPNSEEASHQSDNLLRKSPTKVQSTDRPIPEMHQNVTSPENRTTRSGRIIKTPERYKM